MSHPDHPAIASSLDRGDHRAVAARLDLLHFQEEAPGMVFWHPNGFLLYRLLEDAARRHVEAGGYREVRTPQLMRRAIWEMSGHWRHFHGGMFAFGVDGPDAAALKPVSCPGHVQIVKRAAPSWRDLPIRLAEFGLCHRDEESGALHGLMRLRQFTQDDGHVFCADDHVVDEVERFCRELPAFYRRFGFDDGAVEIALATRPDERAGDDAWWDRAERDLAAAVARLGLAAEVVPGGGAFYGPKLDFALRDRRGRSWQCGTIQLDLVMPRRFDLTYVDRDGQRRHPAMLHRALYGSIERFLGVVLEQHGAALPAWLAPVQVAVLPVGDGHAAWAAEVAARMAGAGLRARVDRDDRLARRVAVAHRDGVSFAAVVGPREVAALAVTLSGGGGEKRTLAIDDAIARLVAACAAPP